MTPTGLAPRIVSALPLSFPPGGGSQLPVIRLFQSWPQGSPRPRNAGCVALRGLDRLSQVPLHVHRPHPTSDTILASSTGRTRREPRIRSIRLSRPLYRTTARVAFNRHTPNNTLNITPQWRCRICQQQNDISAYRPIRICLVS